MKLWKRVLPVLTLALVLVFPDLSQALELPKIVTTEWLEKNGNDPGLRILDIRSADEYKAGHGPNSVHLAYELYAMSSQTIRNEVPLDKELLALMEDAGIGKETAVVVVGKVDTVADQVNRTRVAWTLRYSGIPKVGVLDAGTTNGWPTPTRRWSSIPGSNQQRSKGAGPFRGPAPQNYLPRRVHR